MSREWDKGGAILSAVRVSADGRKTLNVDECREQLRKRNFDCSREDVNYYIIAILDGWRMYAESDDGNNTFFLYNSNCGV